jgi:hypothetical protein
MSFACVGSGEADKDTLVSSFLYGSGSGSGCLAIATALLDAVLFVFNALAFPPFDPAFFRLSCASFEASQICISLALL